MSNTLQSRSKLFQFIFDQYHEPIYLNTSVLYKKWKSVTNMIVYVLLISIVFCYHIFYKHRRIFGVEYTA